MVNRDIFKGFVKGFSLTFLLLLIVGAVVRPTIGWAQGGDEETSNVEALVEMPPDVVITDPTVDLAEIVMAESELTTQSFVAPLIVPAADFNDDGGGNIDYFFSFSGGYIRPNAGSNCLMAPVYLPHAVTIENLYVYTYDNDTSFNFTVNLRRKQNNNTASSEVLGGVTTSGASTSVQIPGDTTITSAVVDNSNYSYFLTTCLSSTNHRIYAAWIFYSEPT